MISPQQMWRRFWVVLRIFPSFFAVLFTRRGLFGREGRILIWGKMRRSFICLFPAWARALQKKHGLTGGCRNCGASCNLLFQCPHWDATSRLCTVYEDRPNICRLYPITPADIRDRNIVSKHVPCGFNFQNRSQS